MSLLTVRNLSQKLGKTPILQSVSFQAGEGQIVALLGPNGAGKTTFLKTIMGLHRTPQANAESGINCISLGNDLINQWPIHKKVSRGLSYLPQQTSLFQHMSVKDNLQLVHEYHDYWNNKSQHDFEEERDRWLNQTDLMPHLEKRAGVLSGGQKRKLEIVRALLMHPKLIMLDEPFAGVDPKSIYELKKIFTEMAERGIGIIISDHHVDQLLSIATLVYVILHGKVVTSGSIKDILESSYTKDSYLGDQFYKEISRRFLG